MKPAKKKSSSQTSWIATGVVILIFLSLAGGLVYLFSTDKGGGKKVFVAKVDLVRPTSLISLLPLPRSSPPSRRRKKRKR